VPIKRLLMKLRLLQKKKIILWNFIFRNVPITDMVQFEALKSIAASIGSS